MRTRTGTEGRTRGDTGRTQSLPAEGRGLRRNRPQPRVDLGLPASRTVKAEYRPSQPPSVWDLVAAAPANSHPPHGAPQSRGEAEVFAQQHARCSPYRPAAGNRPPSRTPPRAPGGAGHAMGASVFWPGAAPHCSLRDTPECPLPLRGPRREHPGLGATTTGDLMCPVRPLPQRAMSGRTRRGPTGCCLRWSCWPLCWSWGW